MTESVSNLYDLAYPSPITLNEISCIVVVVELWREKICAHVESKRLHELDLKDNIQLKNVLPSLPSTIYSSLEEYVGTFGNSIVQWLDDLHKKEVLTCHHEGSKNILSRFHDFAWDWDGTIHDARTAKRMMMCDRLTEDEKFKIACLYCFEDDIKRIWPSASKKMDLIQIDFETYPQQYYWIRYLRNELHMVLYPHHESVDEMMLVECIRSSKWRNRSPEAAKYFWNRLPSDRRTTQITIEIGMCCGWLKSLARFILPKLNSHQLETFLAPTDVAVDLMEYLLCTASAHCVFRTWMLVRNKISSSNFIVLIQRLIAMETIRDRRDEYKSTIRYLYCEIWESAPQHLKRSVLDNVLPDNDSLFIIDGTSSAEWKGMKLLITVLQDATFEVRRSFWRTNWSTLICGGSGEDLFELTELCFENKNEFILFRENVMSRYENITDLCVELLQRGLFNHLNNFLSFCCPDAYKKKELKQRLLRSNYLGENSALTNEVVKKKELLNEFINDTFYDSADLGVEFRNQFTTSPGTNTWLITCIHRGYFTSLMEFVDFFFPEEQVVVALKKRLLDAFKEHLIDGAGILIIDSVGVLQNVLVWLLGGENDVTRIKQSLSVDDIFRGTMQLFHRYAESSRIYENREVKYKFPKRLNDFLMWYFNGNEEEIEVLKKRFPDEMRWIVPQ